nr:HD domain-containing phosphohydrolase [Flexivirga aerilata]
MLVVLVPLVLAQWSYSQLRTEAVAHERTVSSLVAAVDARDPVLRGRNQQVAAVSEIVGNALRLTPKQSEALHFAALLHDIGMVAPAGDRHAPRAELSADDIDRIRSHPELGVEMLRSIVFLADSTTAIRSHHERWDGTGYPDGLAGEEIPLLARILAVADATCALVAADPAGGVPSAIDCLRARAGSQFDPACVEALSLAQDLVADALGQLRADREPQPPAGRGWDHDLPRVSDLLASRARTQT